MIQFHLLLCRNDIEIDYSFYKIRIKNNINLLFLKFVEVFVKFDLKFKIMFIKKQFIIYKNEN